MVSCLGMGTDEKLSETLKTKSHQPANVPICFKNYHLAHIFLRAYFLTSCSFFNQEEALFFSRGSFIFQPEIYVNVRILLKGVKRKLSRFKITL